MRSGALPVFSSVTENTSSLRSGGTKHKTSAVRPSAALLRRTRCHMKPAVSVLSSCAGVKRCASCAALAPTADQKAFSVPTQKFRTPRLLCRFSTLTGSSRNVFWSSLQSPPKFGVSAPLSPSSLATGK